MNIVGTAANDSLEGSNEDDIVSGLVGFDVIITGYGNDVVYGNQGDDSIDGEAGNDILLGGQDHDSLFGNQGDDILYGNLGDDELSGDGNLFTLEAVAAGNDILYGGQGMDLLEGNAGNDVLYGNLGDDLLFGGEGNDILYGGQDTDVLIGGTGLDIAVGGLGSDGFGFTPLGMYDELFANMPSDAINSGLLTDQITDFNAADDVFIFAGLNDANLQYLGTVSGSANDITGVVNAAAAVQAPDQVALVYVTSGTLAGHQYVVYNVQGVEGAIELVNLAGVLTANNFQSLD